MQINVAEWDSMDSGFNGFWVQEKLTQHLQLQKPTSAPLSESISWEAFKTLLGTGLEP